MKKTGAKEFFSKYEFRFLEKLLGIKRRKLTNDRCLYCKRVTDSFMSTLTKKGNTIFPQILIYVTGVLLLEKPYYNNRIIGIEIINLNYGHNTSSVNEKK